MKTRRRVRFGAVLVVALILVVGVSVLVTPQAHANPVIDAVANLIGSTAYQLTRLLGKLMSVMFDVLTSVVQYNGFIDSAAVQTGWAIARDVCNMFFVMVLLVISFGTLFRMEQYRYTALLRKFIVMAVLIQFSLGITGFFIDIMQLIMMTFVNAFAPAAAGNFAQMLGLTKLYNLESASTLGAISQGDIMSALLLGFAMMLVATIVLLVMILMFLGRIIALWILAVLSPFAYFLSIFPSTARYATQWWSTFWKYATIGPVLAFFLWLSFTIAGTGTNKASDLIATPRRSSTIVNPNEFGSEQTKAFVSSVGNNESMLSFMIGIVLLVAGLTVASQAGVAGGAFAGRMAANIQKRGAALPRQFGGFAYRNFPFAQRAAEGAAMYGLAGLSRVPLIGGLGRRGIAGIAGAQKKRKEEEKKTIEAIPTSTKAGRIALGGAAKPWVPGIAGKIGVGAGKLLGRGDKEKEERIQKRFEKWGYRMRPPDLEERAKAAKARLPSAITGDDKFIDYTKTTAAEDMTTDPTTVGLMVDRLQKLMDKGNKNAKPLHELNPDFARRLMGEGVKQDLRKAAGYDERCPSGRLMWAWNSTLRRFEYGGEETEEEIFGKGGVPKIDPVTGKPLTRKRWEGFAVPPDFDYKTKQKPKYRKYPALDQAIVKTTRDTIKSRFGDSLDAFYKSTEYASHPERFVARNDYEAALARETLREEAVQEQRLDPNFMSGIQKLFRQPAKGKQAKFFVNFQDGALQKLGTYLKGEGSFLQGAAKEEAIPVLAEKFRAQQQATGVSGDELERGVTDFQQRLRDASSIALVDKMGFGDVRGQLRHEDVHEPVSSMDAGFKRELFGMLSPQRSQEIESYIRGKWGNGAAMSQDDVIEEWLTEMAATTGRGKPNTPLGLQDSELEINALLAAALREQQPVAVRTEVPLAVPPPFVSPPAGEREISAQPAGEQGTSAQATAPTFIIPPSAGEREISAQPPERIVERIIEAPLSPDVKKVVSNTGIDALRNDLVMRMDRVGADVPRADIGYGLEQLRAHIEEVAREQGVAGIQLQGIRDELDELMGEASSPDRSPEGSAALKKNVLRFLGGLRGGGGGSIPRMPKEGGDEEGGAA